MFRDEGAEEWQFSRKDVTLGAYRAIPQGFSP